MLRIKLRENWYELDTPGEILYEEKQEMKAKLENINSLLKDSPGTINEQVDTLKEELEKIEPSLFFTSKPYISQNRILVEIDIPTITSSTYLGELVDQ